VETGKQKTKAKILLHQTPPPPPPSFFKTALLLLLLKLIPGAKFRHLENHKFKMAVGILQRIFWGKKLPTKSPYLDHKFQDVTNTIRKNPNFFF
jgi:hypothetical protein